MSRVEEVQRLITDAQSEGRQWVNIDYDLAHDDLADIDHVREYLTLHNYRHDIVVAPPWIKIGGFIKVHLRSDT